jgi:hypothetical protein
VTATAKGYASAVFDGRYVYFGAYNNGAPDGVVARFDAKTPSALPAGYAHGSFF